jgi:hypothetical protein
MLAHAHVGYNRMSDGSSVTEKPTLGLDFFPDRNGFYPNAVIAGAVINIIYSDHRYYIMMSLICGRTLYTRFLPIAVIHAQEQLLSTTQIPITVSEYHFRKTTNRSVCDFSNE